MTDPSNSSKLSSNSTIVYILVSFTYILMILTTKSYFWADAPDYVDSIIAYENGQIYKFWEFGHLLWRPIGWSIWTLFCDKSDPTTWRYQIFSVLQFLNYLAGFGSSLLITYILLRLEIRKYIIYIAALGFICSHAFINYNQTGTSYASALFFLLLGIAFSIHRKFETSYFPVILSASAFALSALFWIAFVWVLPAMFFTNVIFQGYSKARAFRAIVCIGTFAIFCSIVYSFAILSLQIGSLTELNSWVTSSAHGNTTSGISRVIFGISRSFIYFSHGGTEVKRYLLSDPYNPVSLRQLIFNAPLGIFLFYINALIVLLVLFRAKAGSKIGIWVVCAVVPLAIFSTFFDGAAVERYLPILGICFIGLAVVLNEVRSRSIRFFVISCLLVASSVNLYSLSVVRIEAYEAMASERARLVNSLPIDDAVFMLNWLDDLVNFNRSFPFNENNLASNRQLLVVVTPGTDQTQHWKEDFSKKVIETWNQGNNIWMSARAFSLVPKADWNWSEGDDKFVLWHDFPAFFSQLHTSESIGGDDGFVLITNNELNRQFIETFINDSLF